LRGFGLLRIVCLLALTDAVLSTSAAADPVSDWQEAKRLRNDGTAAMDRGDFVEAVEAFRGAYKLYPSPNLFYNIGVALDQLGRTGAAVEAFEHFLASAPKARSDARDFATNRLAVLAPGVGRLDLTLSPPDARVTVDGEEARWPHTGGLPVTAGERTVVAEKNGYEVFTAKLTLVAGEQRHLDITLQPKPASVAVVDRPAPPARPRDTTAPALVASAPTAAERKPVYKKWWLWTIVGGVAVAGAVTGVAMATRPTPLTANTSLGVQHPF
jgi:hypothetical protein